MSFISLLVVVFCFTLVLPTGAADVATATASPHQLIISDTLSPALQIPDDFLHNSFLSVSLPELTAQLEKFSERYKNQPADFAPEEINPVLYALNRAFNSDLFSPDNDAAVYDRLQRLLQQFLDIPDYYADRLENRRLKENILLILSMLLKNRYHASLAKDVRTSQLHFLHLFTQLPREYRQAAYRIWNKFSMAIYIENLTARWLQKAAHATAPTQSEILNFFDTEARAILNAQFHYLHFYQRIDAYIHILRIREKILTTFRHFNTAARNPYRLFTECTGFTLSSGIREGYINLSNPAVTVFEFDTMAAYQSVITEIYRRNTIPIGPLTEISQGSFFPHLMTVLLIGDEHYRHEMFHALLNLVYHVPEHRLAQNTDYAGQIQKIAFMGLDRTKTDARIEELMRQMLQEPSIREEFLTRFVDGEIDAHTANGIPEGYFRLYPVKKSNDAARVITLEDVVDASITSIAEPDRRAEITEAFNAGISWASRGIPFYCANLLTDLINLYGQDRIVALAGVLTLEEYSALAELMYWMHRDEIQPCLDQLKLLPPHAPEAVELEKKIGSLLRLALEHHLRITHRIPEKEIILRQIIWHTQKFTIDRTRSTAEELIQHLVYENLIAIRTRYQSLPFHQQQFSTQQLDLELAI